MALQPNEVKTEHIGNAAVTAPKISIGAVGSNQLANGSVITTKIADEAVTTAKLKDSAIKTAKIAAGAITGSKIGDNQIYGSKLRDSAVRAEKIAAGAVTTAKIGELQVTGSRIQDRAVTTEKIANSAVTTPKIADGSVTPAKLSFTLPAPGGLARPITPPVATAEIADAAVTAVKIAANAVTKAKMADNSVGYLEIASQSLEPKGIKTLAGLPPAPGQVPVYDESGPNYWWFRWADPATRPLTPPLASAELGAGSVESDKIAANAVTSDKIEDGAVTPAKLSFNPAQLRVGMYDGDGQPSQVIAIPGLNPQAVIIYPQASGLDGPYIRVGGDSWTQTISWAALGLVYGGDLILLGSDGFTVAGGTNTNGVRYSYIAVG